MTMDFVIFQSMKHHYKMDIQTWCGNRHQRIENTFLVLLASLLLLTFRSAGINIQLFHSMN